MAQNRTSTVLNHTIPPFYACYLLRSHARPKMTYIGSTPDPVRRIKQHNGQIKGGAHKTRLARPWTMSLLVHGFPSKLQALQFEWAWQNPHASRHLHSIHLGTSGKALSQFPKTRASGRALIKVQVLMWMLTSKPWERFGLKVVLFEPEARAWWNRARELGPIVRTELQIRKHEKLRDAKGDEWGEGRGAFLDRVHVLNRFEGVDPNERPGTRFQADDDGFFHPHWAKWSDRLHSATSDDCGICHKPVDLEDHLSFLLCTSTSTSSTSASMSSSSSVTAEESSCQAIYHIPCLAHHFIHHTSSSSSTTTAASHLATSNETRPLLPTRSTCPTCSSELHWQDLIRGAYRRVEETEGRRKKAKGTRRGRKKGTAEGQEVRGRGNGEELIQVVDDEESDVSQRFDFDDDDDDGEDEDSQDEVERSMAMSVEADGSLDLVEVGSGDEEEIVAADKAKKRGRGRARSDAKVVMSPKKRAPRTKSPKASASKATGKGKAKGKAKASYIDIST